MTGARVHFASKIALLGRGRHDRNCPHLRRMTRVVITSLQHGWLSTSLPFVLA
jgi:hypothetical protein